jgi:cell division protein FtsI/penicillin-binding protein 2
MFKRNQKRKRIAQVDNSRLHVVMAIIFLLSFAVIVRLYSLQVMKYDLYTAIAANQHEVSNKLAPNRGKIFIQDNIVSNEDGLYPVASNKEFALVYAVPKVITDPDLVAEKLFEIFDRVAVEKEVDELLEDDALFSTSSTIVLTVIDKENIEEFKKIKRESEIQLRQEAIIEKYVVKLSKEDDPYEPIKRKVDEETLAAIAKENIKGINYIMETFRYYPEKNIGAHILGFANYDNIGRYGLEGFFNDELTGIAGSVKTERSAEGKLIIINDREHTKQQDGSDLILSINRSIQFTACTKLKSAVEKYNAEGGSVIVMDPMSGAIISMCNYPDFDPNIYSEIPDVNVFNNSAIFDAYEPGSTFKTFTVAAGIDQDRIKPSTIYNDKGYIMIEGWNKPIKNSDFETKGGYGWVDMNTVLADSLNTGTIFIQKKVGDDMFADYVKRFGFGEKTGVELETEGISNIVNLNRNRKRPIEMATASFGQGITATPLQMIAAYSAIANGGILFKPYLVEEVVNSQGERTRTQPVAIRRVISERTALLVSGMLVNVVDGGHAKLAGVNGYFIAGKTGTAQVAEKGEYGDKTVHSFVGFAPVDDPKFVMLVKLDAPTEVKFSASSAAPLFGELAEFILSYYKIPKER